MAHSVNILDGVVLGGWSPSGYDLRNGGAVVVADVTTEEYEAGAHTVNHRGELFKVGVGGVGDFA